MTVERACLECAERANHLMEAIVERDTVATNKTEGPAARILVVEDEPDIAALIAYQLTREGYRVETTSNGAEALDACFVPERMLEHVDTIYARVFES